MPVVSVKARARIPTSFMAITTLQRCLELFEAGARRDAKQTIAIAVKYPMKSAAIVISSITLTPVLKRSRKFGRKAVP
jgi:hypothetical protein